MTLISLAIDETFISVFPTFFESSSFQMEIFSTFWKHSYHIVGQQVNENAKTTIENIRQMAQQSPMQTMSYNTHVTR